MPDVDFINTEDVDWATGEDVAFDGTYVATTPMFIFLFDDSDAVLDFDNDDRLMKV